MPGIAEKTRRRRSQLCQSVAIISVVAGIGLGGSPARAACSSFAPADGASVTCDGANVTGVVASGSTGVTLELLSGGSLAPASGPAIWLGPDADVTLRSGSSAGSLGQASYAVLLGEGSSLLIEGTVLGNGVAGANQDPGAPGLVNAQVTLAAGGQIVTDDSFSNGAIDGHGGGNSYQIDGAIISNGSYGLGIEVGAGDTLTLGATGSILTKSGASSDGVSGFDRDGVTVVMDKGSQITIHGQGRGIELGANAEVTVAGTITSLGDATTVNSSGGGGIDVGPNAKVWLQADGKIVTGNGDGLGNGGTGAIGITTFESGPSNSVVTVDGLIQTQKAHGIFAGTGDSITVGATGQILLKGGASNAHGIYARTYTSAGNDRLTIDVAGRIENLGSGSAIYIQADPGTATDTALHADVTIEAGGSLHAANREAYNQLDGAGQYPEVIDNLVVAGSITRGTAGRVINLDDGADTITLLPTYHIVGTIDGGSDAGGQPETDTFALDGADGTSGSFDFAVSPLARFEAGLKKGLGTWVLQGTSGSGLIGSFAVEAGTLLVEGTLSQAGASVASGASLGGGGTVAGTVSVLGGGTLQGRSGQQLTVGSLFLDEGALVEVALGAPSDNALFKVTQDLTLDGTLNVGDAGGFGLGVYRLMDYGGTLTDQGLAIGTLPAGFEPGDLSVQTAIAQQVNLVVDDGPGPVPTLQFWNGTTTAPHGGIVGGNGTWSADQGLTNWTDAAGERADPWSGHFAVFQGTAGLVTIDGEDGAVQATGLQFAVDGYSLAGDSLTLAGGEEGTTIRVGDGSQQGAGFTATIGAVLTGSGGLVKDDLGTLVLTAANSYAGGILVKAGTLAVQGRIGAVEVLSGASLKGTGTLGTTELAAGALHAPGNSIGTQTILGDYGNHGTLEIEVQPGAADQLIVTGNVDITGAALSVVELTSQGWPLTSSFTIIDNQGASAVTGSFASVANLLAFLDPSVDYAGGDGNDVVLTLVRNTVDFAAIGATPNQQATGAGVESLGPGNAVYDAVLPLTVPQAQEAFDQLSGEIYASARSVLLEDSRFLREATLDRLNAVEGDATGEATGLWIQGFGSWGHIDGDGNAARIDSTTGGVFVGADTLIAETWRLGIVGGYSHVSFDVDDRDSSGDSDNYHVGLYSGTSWGPVGLRLGAAYTWHSIDVTRAVSFPGFAENLDGDYDAGTAQVFGEVGYRFDLAPLMLQPFGNVAYVNLHSDGVDESGGAAALSGNSEDGGLTFTTLGLRLGADVALAPDTRLTLLGSLGWRHAFGDVSPETTFAFAGGDAFTIAGVPVARDTFVAEAGLGLALTDGVMLGVSYMGQVGGDVLDNGVRATLAVQF